MRFIVFLLLALLAVPACAEEFTYELPPGWVDLAKRGPNTFNAPEFLINEARSGKYRIWAADPDRITRLGAPVNMNVVEQPGTGKVTEEVMREAVDGMRKQLDQLGVEYSLLGQPQIRKMNGVNVGIVESQMTTPQGSLRMRQYFIPGEKKAAVITYACPPDDWDDYQNLFDVSAHGTKGAHEHGGGIHWSRALRTGAFGAFIGAIVGAIIGLAKKLKKPAPVTPRVVASMWECATCKRKVPLRMDVCRCGAGRPVAG